MCLASIRSILRLGIFSSRTFDNFTEYFMLSRNASVCFTFRTYDKITRVAYVRMIQLNMIRVIRMNRTMSGGQRVLDQI